MQKAAKLSTVDVSTHDAVFVPGGLAPMVDKEGQLSAVLNLLAEVAKKSIEEKGNLFYIVHQSNSDANTLILFEGYADESAVEEHRKSAYFQNLVVGQIIPNLQNREVILASQLNFD